MHFYFFEYFGIILLASFISSYKKVFTGGYIMASLEARGIYGGN